MSKKTLLTLGEVAFRIGVSYPTIRRYRKIGEPRLPFEGEGRMRRYPLSSLPIFRQIKKETMSRWGRPRKDEQKDGLRKDTPKRDRVSTKKQSKKPQGKQSQLRNSKSKTSKRM